MMMSAPPLALYIHFPWCVKKCPYCDFNSHALKGELPEQAYLEALTQNLLQLKDKVAGRELVSIFMGGGTPSLFSAATLKKLMQVIQENFALVQDIEITLEANPGTVEQQRFAAYRELGINRLSLGVQSLNDVHLEKLGRIHDSATALKAINHIKTAGFTNFNIDIMFGLPDQTLAQGMSDLQLALDQNPTHLSWYELTLEPNTYFWHHPPKLPQDDQIIDLQEQGQKLLAAKGLAQYEVSAYSAQPCQHNLNYWQFGDYLAIGAGAHGKITTANEVLRFHHFRHPKQYMAPEQGYVQEQKVVATDQLAFEFMLNALRLKNGVATHTFHERTGLDLSSIAPQLRRAQQQGWLVVDEQRLCTTETGFRFLNNVIELFL